MAVVQPLRPTDPALGASHVQLAPSLVALKAALLAHFYPSGLTASYTLSSAAVVTAGPVGWPTVATRTTLVFDLGHGFTSTIYVDVPLVPNGEGCIVHGGHDGDPTNLAGPYVSTLTDLHTAGFTTISCAMLFHGSNSSSVNATVPGVGAVVMTGHEDLVDYEGTAVNGVTKMIDHVIQALNWLDENMSLTRVHMIGLSGGGWTTCLVAALDTRLHHAMCVAGAISERIKASNANTEDFGDYEQETNADWRAIAGYEDVFALAAFNRPTGGAFDLVYNQFDYYFSSYNRFADIDATVTRVKKRLGFGAVGRLSWAEDTSHGSTPKDIAQHIISAWTRARWLAQLET